MILQWYKDGTVTRIFGVKNCFYNHKKYAELLADLPNVAWTEIKIRLSTLGLRIRDKPIKTSWGYEVTLRKK